MVFSYIVVSVPSYDWVRLYFAVWMLVNFGITSTGFLLSRYWKVLLFCGWNRFCCVEYVVPLSVEWSFRCVDTWIYILRWMKLYSCRGNVGFYFIMARIEVGSNGFFICCSFMQFFSSFFFLFEKGVVFGFYYDGWARCY